MEVNKIIPKAARPVKESVKTRASKKAKKAKKTRTIKDRVEISKKNNILASARDWVKTNIIGTTAPVKGKKGKKVKKVDKDYGDDRIGLYAGIGAGAGAAVGAAVGMAASSRNIRALPLERFCPAPRRFGSFESGCLAICSLFLAARRARVRRDSGGDLHACRPSIILPPAAMHCPVFRAKVNRNPTALRRAGPRAPPKCPLYPEFLSRLSGRFPVMKR